MSKKKMSKNMTLVLAQVKKTYSGHDRLDEMTEDIKGGSITYWADQFCDEEFGANKTLARSVYELALEYAEDNRDIRMVADSVSKEVFLNDKEWGKSLYEQCIQTSDGSFDELCALGNSIADALGDKDWARRLFEQAEKAAEGTGPFHYLGTSVLQESALGDVAWARSLYEKAEAVAADFFEWKALAEVVYSELKDEKWARRIYEKAEAVAADFSEWKTLAETVCSELKDEKWARRIYEKAEQSIENPSDLIGLGDSILDERYLVDNIWARRLYEKAEASSTNFWELVNLGRTLCYGLNEKVWGRRVFEKAEQYASSYDMENLADEVENEDYLGDSEWAKRLRGG